MDGYRDPRYVRHLGDWGTPIELPAAGGWLLARMIPGTTARDAMGPYPLFACRDWTGLAADLAALPSDLVSVLLVTDPFGTQDGALLASAFSDLARPYRRHFLVDLDRPPSTVGARRSRQTARRALRDLTVEHVPQPATMVDLWTDLYRHLAARHALEGILAFSRRAFAMLLAIPGVELMLARHEGIPVAGQVYLPQDDVIHCHLAAGTPEAYRLGAFHALDRSSIDVFSGRARWLDLGGGAGEAEDDGLAFYKSRWATDTRWTWLCGRILDRARYAELTRSAGAERSPWFPAYRNGVIG